MLFNSYEFIFLFLPITLIAYFALTRFRLPRLARAALVVASLVFYARWNPVYLPLILGSIAVNFSVAQGMIHTTENRRLRKALFLTGLAFNVGLLGFFKYADFFVDNVNQVAGSEFNLLYIVLPLGISFFTLQQIAYQVDVFEGLVAEQDALDYALFVAFFPQLIAGPIVHHKQMMPQFRRLRNAVFSYRNASTGVYVFAIGLFKKVVLADTFSVWASAGFDGGQALTLVAAWTTSLAYTLQLYFDFSGYSDMAIGIGLLFNIRLPVNFYSPYKATSVVDFWNRWHMTLTQFITTYVYFPIVRALGAVTFNRSMLAIFVAMFISGLWHGAAWTFVIWGLMHSTAIVVNHLWKRQKWKMPRAAAWALTLLFVNTALVVFRARTWDDATRVLRGMSGLEGWSPKVDWNSVDAAIRSMLTTIDGGPSTWLMIVGGLVAVLTLKNSIDIRDQFEPRLQNAAIAVAMITFAVYRLGLKSEFLYFQF